jgi:hypothetical protein
MYIIHETLAGNDPRIHPETVVVGDYWHFTIRYIPPNKGIFIDWLPHENISEEVAKCCMLTGSYKGVLSISKPVTKKEDIVNASGDVEWKKYIYKLSAKDKENVVIIMKTAMRLYANTYITDQKTLKRLIKEVNSTSTIESCEHLLHHYYGVGSATTNGLPRNPEFNIKWPWEEKVVAL